MGLERLHLLAHDLGVEQGLGFDSHLPRNTLCRPRPETKPIERRKSTLPPRQSHPQAIPKLSKGSPKAHPRLLHGACRAVSKRLHGAYPSIAPLLYGSCTPLAWLFTGSAQAA